MISFIGLFIPPWGGHEALQVPTCVFYKMDVREAPPLPYTFVPYYVGLTSSKAFQRLTPIFECTQLRFLYLGLSHSKEIPTQIGRLQALTRLSIGGSHSLIERLPDTIGHLTQNTNLSLYNMYALKELPDSLQQLSKLRSLSIDGHSIPKSRKKNPSITTTCTDKFLGYAI